MFVKCVYNNYFIRPKHFIASSDYTYWSEWLESTRKDVECTFGILKGRFRVLKKKIEFQTQKTLENTFRTCCILHNMLIRWNHDTKFSDCRTEWENNVDWNKLHAEGFTEESLNEQPEDINCIDNSLSVEEMKLANNGQLIPFSTCKNTIYENTLRGQAEVNGVGRYGITTIEEIPTQDSNKSISLESHDSTRAIGFHTLMHLTNALVTHFTYAFNIGEVDWPKRFSKNHKFNYRLIPNAIKRAAKELQKDLYLGPSTLLAYNKETKEFDKEVGIGLYVNRSFTKGEIVAEFIGEMKSVISYEKYMVDSGRGGNAIYINEHYVLDCYKTKMDRTCLASYANCPSKCYDTCNNRSAEPNMKLSICSKQRRVTLKAITNITQYSEVFYSYGNSYVYPL